MTSLVLHPEHDSRVSLVSQIACCVEDLALLVGNERRGSKLADTLVAWLNAFGDVPSTTTDLDIHPNTLRYRLKRIDEITGLDLRHDPLARLELHLRLLTRR